MYTTQRPLRGLALSLLVALGVAHGQVKVRVGINEYRPLVFTGTDGRAQGLFIDVLEEVAGEEGWLIEYVRGEWHECLERLDKGEINLLVAVGHSAERAQRFDFTKEPLWINWAEVYAGKRSGVQALLDLRDKTVAVVKGDAFVAELDRLLKGFDVHCTMTEVIDYLTVLEHVQDGSAHAGVMSRLFGMLYAPEYDVARTSILFSPIEIRFAVPKGRSQPLVEAIDRHVAALKQDRQSTYYESLARWLHPFVVVERPQWPMGLAAVVAVLLTGALTLAARRAVRAHRALRESRARYQDLYENAPNAYFSIGGDGHVRACNRKVLGLLGYSPQDLIGRPVAELYADLPTGKPRALEVLERFRRGETVDGEELQMRRADGSPVWIGLTVNAIRDAEGRVVESRSVVSDISKHKAAEEALRASEALLQSVLGTAPAGIGLVRQRRLVWLNEKLCEMSGYTREELQSRNLRMLYPPDEDLAWIDRERERLARERGPGSVETRWLCKNGDVINVMLVSTLFDAEDLSQGTVFAALDITEHKAAEEELRDSEERFRTLVANVPGAVYRCAWDDDWTMEFLSDQIEAICGFPAEEFIGSRGRTFASVIHADDRQAVADAVGAAVHDDRPYVLDYRVVHRDGTVRWVYERGRAVRGPEGQVLWLDGVIHDVTDRETAQEELRQSEERYRSLFEHANDAVLVIERGRIAQCNPKALEIFGRTREEMIGQHPYDLSPEHQPCGRDSREMGRATLARLSAGELQFFEWQHSRPDGTPFDVEVSLSRFDLSGEPVLMAIMRDVTERKRMETALREKEAREALVLRALPMAFYVAQPSGDFGGTWVSEQIEQIAGFAPEAFMADTHLWANRLHPADHDRVLAEFDRLFDQDAIAVEYRWQTANGEYRWFLDQAVLVRSETGEPSQVIGTWLDVTERKRAEELLRESEERYRNFLTQSLAGIWRYELRRPMSLSLPIDEQVEWLMEEAVLVECNDVVAQMYGLRGADDVVRGRYGELFQHDERGAREMLRAWIEEGHRFDGRETLDLTTNGEYRWFLKMGHSVIEDNQMIGSWGIQVDITDRKRTEEELRASETKLRAIFDHRHQLTGLLNPEGRLLAANKTALELVGADEADVIGRHFWDTPWWDRSQEPQLRHAVEQAAGGESVRFETTHPDVDGEIRHIDFSLTPVQDDEGNVVCLVPEGLDITESKRAERALQESHSRLREAQLHFMEAGKMAAVGQMAAGVAHEINNPLASIATSAEILSDAVETADADVAPAKERLEKHLRRIQDNAYRCKDIIQRLMDFARGEIEDLTRVDLRELVADTVALVSGDARCKCRQLAITNQPLAPLGDVDFAHLEALEETGASAQPALEGWTRPRVLQQVFLNLLLNALDATPEGGRIAVACVPKDDGVEVAVADDGTGIEPEHVGRVFDAFFTTKPPGKGSGLGLNLTRQIVRSLEGTVTVESEHGRGTIMRVWLPLDPRQAERA